jgi:hypothetical protein
MNDTERDRLINALRAVEYCISGYDGTDGSSSQLCPICGYTPLDGHADDCIIGSAIKPHNQGDGESSWRTGQHVND